MPPVVGYATTATHRSAAPQVAEHQYAGFPGHLERLAEVPEPRVVVYQDLDDPHVGAVFGEVMCTSLQKFGCVGLITNGPGRDMEQIRRLGFPTFTNGIVCSHGYATIVDINVPVNIGGLAVNPGDLIHADLNGVTTIPNQIAGSVAALCEELVAVEEKMLTALKQEDTTVSDIKQQIFDMRNRLAGLREQAARLMQENGTAVRK